MYIVYGIPNCNTVKKALDWLKLHKIPYTFHDYKKLGVGPQKLQSWCQQVGWETLLNKKGTTWRNAGPLLQAKLVTEKAVIKWLTENTSALKRPLVEKADQVMAVGFDEAIFEKVFTPKKSRN